MDIPVQALKAFSHSPNGIDTFAYQEGEIYPLPARIAESYARLGYVKIVEVVQEKPKPKPKTKRKRKKDTEDE